MELVECTACGSEVSEKAKECPDCGHPVNEPDLQKIQELENSVSTENESNASFTKPTRIAIRIFVLGAIIFSILAAQSFYLAFLFSIGYLIHFIPAFNAISRDHEQMSAISALNFFLGWTVLGWIGALVWSMTE